MPPLRTHEQIAASGALAEEKLGGTNPHPPPKTAHYKRVSALTKGVVGRSPLLELSYFDIATMTIPDMMHLVPGVVGRHFFAMIFGEKLANQAKNLQKKANKAIVEDEARAAKHLEAAGEKYLVDHQKWQREVAALHERFRGGKNERKHQEALARHRKEPQMPVWKPQQPEAAAQVSIASCLTGW
jgi:hypothetical protein